MSHTRSFNGKSSSNLRNCLITNRQMFDVHTVRNMLKWEVGSSSLPLYLLWTLVRNGKLWAFPGSFEVCFMILFGFHRQALGNSHFIFCYLRTCVTQRERIHSILRVAIEPSMLLETIQYLLLLRLEMPDACLTVFLYRFLNTDRWAGSNSRQRAGKWPTNLKLVGRLRFQFLPIASLTFHSFVAKLELGL